MPIKWNKRFNNRKNDDLNLTGAWKEGLDLWGEGRCIDNDALHPFNKWIEFGNEQKIQSTWTILYDFLVEWKFY